MLNPTALTVWHNNNTTVTAIFLFHPAVSPLSRHRITQGRRLVMNRERSVVIYLRESGVAVAVFCNLVAAIVCTVFCIILPGVRSPGLYMPLPLVFKVGISDCSGSPVLVLVVSLQGTARAIFIFKAPSLVRPSSQRIVVTCLASPAVNRPTTVVAGTTDKASTILIFNFSYTIRPLGFLIVVVVPLSSMLNGLAACFIEFKVIAVKSALDPSRKGKHKWSTVVYHPGQFIHAELQFEERSGGPTS